ncbi:hypothetical protein [Tenacibaculum dicentrarchi]|uniref:hypothetical protein n=1 Tax=Tenacibaculum dicentrarchi TaxID=669041 RepID=UPI00351853CF
MASLVDGAKYPPQTDEVERVTKTLVITKKGLRFNRKTGQLQKNKKNASILRTYAHQMNYQTLYGATAFLTTESKTAVNNS